MHKNDPRRALALTLTLALGALLGCGAEELPVQEEQSALNFSNCVRVYNQCIRACQRIVQQGGDPSNCEVDCGAQLNSCYCNVTPYECVGE